MIPSSGAEFPNPDTYLNHLTPQEAVEYEATRNILIVLLGVSFLRPFCHVFPCSTTVQGKRLGYTCRYP
jgi:hypothetical protein